MKRLALGLTMTAGLFAGAPAHALDEVTFGTNWRAQAEHGGYYQAVADGTYEKYGLHVTIRQGGPQAPNRALLASGQIDFYMGADLLGSFSAVEKGIPTVVVGAIFQKEPQALMAHPDAGVQSFADLGKLKTLIISGDRHSSFYLWLEHAYPGFETEQVKTYTFDPATFIADKDSVQQGYVTSEPYAVKQAAGWEPKVFLLADAGFDTYSTTIETRRALIEKNPDLVQRFVDATIIGWRNYLNGDNAAANALIKQDDPAMSDGQIAFSIEQMKKYGIVVSGEAETGGIGCMTDARIESFYGKMVKAGVTKAGLDLKKAYTTQFVCKGVGVKP